MYVDLEMLRDLQTENSSRHLNAKNLGVIMAFDRTTSEDNGLLTVGYEKMDINTFVDGLKAADVDVVVDIRDLPLSRKKGFSKKSLASALAAVEIDYLHVKALGDPKPGREAARAGEYDRFREIFAAHIDTSEAEAALDEIAASASEKRVCLLCFEREHDCCHRSIVAQHILNRANVSIHHLKI